MESVTVYQYEDEDTLINRIDQAIAELQKLNALMDQQQNRPLYRPPTVVTRRIIHERHIKHPEPKIAFPMSLVAFLAKQALTALEWLGQQFVTRFIPWLFNHLYRFLHPQQSVKVAV